MFMEFTSQHRGARPVSMVSLAASLVAISLIASLAVFASQTAQAQSSCAGRAVTVDLALGQLPTSGDDVIVGTSGSDFIAASSGDDIICGGGGADQIWGQAGNDTVYGGDGDDKIRGGDGDDELRGGPGADDLNGGRDDDAVYGEAGADTKVRGGTGDDIVDGGDGDDVLVAGNGGADTVVGGAGNDVLVTGGPRPDTVIGGPGNDVLKGHKGADSLFGEAGNDELLGGAQPDTLDGGSGFDTCNGGSELATATGCEVTSNVSVEPPPTPIPPQPTPTPIPAPGGANSVGILYVVPSGVTAIEDMDARSAATMAAIQTWLAADTGRQLRVDPTVTRVDLAVPSTTSTAQLSDLIASAGHGTPGKVYVVLYDGVAENDACGKALARGPAEPTYSYLLMPVCDIYPQPGPQTFPFEATYLVLHELLHALGAVPSCAPNHTSVGHVSDSNRDVLYEGPLGRDWDNLTIDVGNDDYLDHSNAGCPDIADSPFWQ